MKILLLAGQGINNKTWIEEVRDTFKTVYDDCEIMYYDHWESGEPKADVDKESEKLINIVNGINGEYMIFAKSIGSVIYLNSIGRLSKQPVKVVLVGVPYNLATEKGYDFNTLKALVDYPVSIWQKESDPYAGFNELSGIAGGSVSVNKYEVEGEPSDDHHYASMEKLLEII